MLLVSVLQRRDASFGKQSPQALFSISGPLFLTFPTAGMQALACIASASNGRNSTAPKLFSPTCRLCCWSCGESSNPSGQEQTVFEFDRSRQQPCSQLERK